MMSAAGPSSAVVRHVLLTLSIRWNEDGESCYPSIATIAAQTALNRRTVQRAVQAAIEEGWIRREPRRSGGRSWSYVATMPDESGRVAEDRPPTERDHPSRAAHRRPHASDDASAAEDHPGGGTPPPRGRQRTAQGAAQDRPSSPLSSPLTGSDEEATTTPPGGGPVVVALRDTAAAWRLPQPSAAELERRAAELAQKAPTWTAERLAEWIDEQDPGTPAPASLGVLTARLPRQAERRAAQSNGASSPPAAEPTNDAGGGAALLPDNACRTPGCGGDVPPYDRRQGHTTCERCREAAAPRSRKCRTCPGNLAAEDPDGGQCWSCRRLAGGAA